MEGDVENGIIEESSMTVLDSIKEDAVEYKVNTPVQYAEAVLVYANTSSADGHPDVINAITNITSEDIARFQARQARATYGTRCSNANLATRSDCIGLLSNMYKGKVKIGNTRGVSTYGGCKLRIGSL
ncbi:hypothetical protein QQZ08_012056 [Neonectria magnoliae]|uniref:Uncharacterized protein n=1 Tax=Neonectria magnoliae TaxID=2732573 RepID=A0ABR1H5W1_9HYPO